MKNKKSTLELSTDRIFFNDNTTRDHFFSFLKFKFGSWHNLAKHFSIRRTQLDIIRKGTRSISAPLFHSFIQNFPKNKRQGYLNSIHSKNRYWGARKGGISTYSKHPDIFQIGRGRGSPAPKYHFNYNMPLTEDLAELLGAHIGDGFTNRYKGRYMIQFSGHAILDRDYHKNFLLRVIRSMSSDCNPVLNTKDNTIRLTINSKELHLLFTKRFGFPAGPKTFTVKIPEEIFQSPNKKLLYCCLRGIFDTDGFSFFDKRKSYSVPYVRIGLHMESKPLMQQVFQVLTDTGINATMTQNGTRLQINGVKECRKFMNVIGFRNQRHLSKLKEIFPSYTTIHYTQGSF